MTQPTRTAIADRWGMDSRSMAGPLPSRLEAARAAGFGQIMLWASDLVAERPLPDALRAVRESGLRITGLQLLRDAEGIGDGPSRRHKLEQAGALLRLCVAVGAPLLLVCSNVSPESHQDIEVIVEDLRVLARLAEGEGVRVAYEALSWGHAVKDIGTAWDIVRRVDRPAVGLAVDTLHLLAARTRPEALTALAAEKVFLLQLSDCLTRNLETPAARLQAARHGRVFPGEGLHSAEMAAYLATLEAAGYDGPCSLEVFHDDFGLMPAAAVAERAARSVRWMMQERA